jgi:hypothetical protein
MFVKTKLTGFDFHQQSRKFVYFNGNASVYGGQSKFYECVYGMTILVGHVKENFIYNRLYLTLVAILI